MKTDLTQNGYYMGKMVNKHDLKLSSYRIIISAVYTSIVYPSYFEFMYLTDFPAIHGPCPVLGRRTIDVPYSRQICRSPVT